MFKFSFKIPRLFLPLALLCLIWGSLNALTDANPPPPTPSPTIFLEGFLSKELLEQKQQQLQQLIITKAPSLALLIHSTSGDLPAVLDFATELARWKIDTQGTLDVYIDRNAIGPAALFPFLADRLDAGFGATWGDILYAAEGEMPLNQLRSRLWVLMGPRKSKEPLWQDLSNAMLNASQPFKLLSTQAGERLILNAHQMQELRLIQAPMEKELFFAKKGEQLAPEAAQKAVVDRCTAKLLGKIKFTNTPGQEPTVGYLKIDDRTSGITPATWLYIRAGLEHYKKTRPLFVLVELNTPGGEVYPAQQISDALKDLDTQDEIPVVVYINNWAISAGAMIAYSARVITTASDGSMGAAEPVIASAEGKMETASEKVNSALRADFANRAKFFGRDPVLAEGMVDKDPLIVLRHGKIIKLGSEQQLRTTGPEADIVIKPKGKLLTLNAQQQLELNVADCIIAPVKTAPITAAEEAGGSWSTKKHPLFSSSYFSTLPEAKIDAFYPDWKLRFFAFLARPEVSSLLFMMLMLGIYMEISSPGAALPGSVALIAFSLIVLSSYAHEASRWLEYIFILVGLGLLALEFFVLPTWGLIGAAGGLALIAGLLGLMLPSLRSISFDSEARTWNAAGEVFIERLWWLLGAALLSVLCMAVLWRFFAPKLALWTSFVLKGEQESSQGFYAGLDPKTLPEVGSKGKVLAAMRPAGRVLIEGKPWDAVSTGGFIEEGDPVIVVRIEGGRMFVAKDQIQGERP